jgi:hypothetical protein
MLLVHPSDMLYFVMLNQALFWLLEASLSLSMRVYYFCLVVPFECHSRNPLMRQALPSDFSFLYSSSVELSAHSMRISELVDSRPISELHMRA